MKAETMCEYTRDEFERGMRELGCDGAAKLRAKLGTLRGSLSDADTFRAVYAWVFDFAKDSGQKSLKKEIACAMWPVVFSGGRFEHLDAWCEFVMAQAINYVLRDTWMLLLDFAALDVARQPFRGALSRIRVGGTDPHRPSAPSDQIPAPVY